MKIQAENKAHTPCYPVIAAVAAAMLTLPACAEQTQAPQSLRGTPKPKVESKEAGKEQRSQQPVMGKFAAPAKPERPPQQLCGRKKVAPPKPKVESREAGKEQRSQQPVMGKRPPQGVVGKIR